MERARRRIVFAGGSRCRDRARVATVMKTIVRMGLLTWLGLAAARSVAASGRPAFRDKVAPILERRCLHCHGEATHKGNLSLSTAAAAFKGGDSGPAVVPGKPEESILLDMIGGDPPEMPQKDKPLSKQEVAVHPELDRARRRLAGRAGAQGSPFRGSALVGLRAARSPAGSHGARVDLGTHADRLIHPGHARAAGARRPAPRPIAAP